MCCSWNCNFNCNVALPIYDINSPATND
jgi:hypothetical protein